jgi:hypothetical protein
MKTYFLLSIIIITAFSCNTKKSEQKTTDSDTVVLNRVTDSSNIKIDGHYFWSAELAPTSGVVMKRTTPLPADSVTAPNIIQMLNNTYPEIPLQIGKVSNDTMFVKISNSKYLTQQMGSSGPEVYMAEVTYNLTEIAGINFVAIMFKEGDHARPGIFSRTDFVK